MTTHTDQTDPGRMSRYEVKHRIMETHFGEVVLAWDKTRGCDVIIKKRKAWRTNKKTGATWLTHADGTETLTFENQKHEAEILESLTQDGETTIVRRTCGLSKEYVRILSDLERHVLNESSVMLGGLGLVDLVEHFEEDGVHHMVTEHYTGGDAMTLINSVDYTPNEDTVRVWMRTLCEAVLFLHARSVAHCDISLENVCFDDLGNESPSAVLIDFGAAVEHPARNNTQRHMHLASDSIDEDRPYCCYHCSNEHYVALRDRKLKFMCRPSCALVSCTGKLSFSSFEKASWLCYDLYANDVYALGIVMCALLTKRCLFTKACTSDPNFNEVVSGRWMTKDPNILIQEFQKHNISHEAVALIDSIIKPQHMRPTIDQVLSHAWFSKT